MEKTELSEFFPFGETRRVGNFKMWRSKTKIKTTDGQMEIETLNVSSLSGEWSVRVPETYEMYGIIVGVYKDYLEGGEEEVKQAETYLYKVFSNMLFASVVGNGYFQQGIEMLAMVYANPSLLSTKGEVQDAFFADVRRTVDNFLEWRKGYDAEVAKNEPTEDDDHRDDIADQASEIIAE